jgi:hypothetical protein
MTSEINQHDRGSVLEPAGIDQGHFDMMSTFYPDGANAIQSIARSLNTGPNRTRSAALSASNTRPWSTRCSPKTSPNSRDCAVPARVAR